MSEQAQVQEQPQNTGQETPLIMFLKQNKSEAYNLYSSITSEFLYILQFKLDTLGINDKIHAAYYLGLAEGYFDGLITALFVFGDSAKAHEYIKDLSSRAADKTIKFINDLLNIYYSVINHNGDLLGLAKIIDEQLFGHKNRIETALSRYLSDIADILVYFISECKNKS